MKTAYFDCNCGVSGDMVLGALIDSGLDVSLLITGLEKLKLSGYQLKTVQDKRKGITGTRALVETTKTGPDRNLDTITSIIESSELPPPVKEKSVKIFHRLGKVEAGIHGISIDKIHFHEVGALDSIIDIVGAVLGFHLLGVDKIIFSPIHVGSSFVECAHGKLPLPAPATAKLLEGYQSFSSGIRAELATPTGVCILTTLGSQAPQPLMRVDSVGYGLGSRKIEEIPNALRVFIGNTEGAKQASTLVIETDIDDMPPEAIGNVMEKLFQSKALDVNFTPIFMKKNRPGTRITVIAEKTNRDRIISVLLEETTTFGVRYYETARVELERRFETVETPYGPVKVKVGLRNGKVLKKSPEYEDCRKIAEKQGIPLLKIYSAINKLL